MGSLASYPYPYPLDLLKGLGCDYRQGWLFSQALAPEDVEEVLEEPQKVLGPLVGSR